MTARHLLLWCALAATTWAAAAPPAGEQDAAERPNTFTLTGQLFTRGEWRNGGMDSSDDDNSDATPTDDYAAFVLSRMRLTADYERQALEMRVTAQHNGVWGQSGKGTFNVYEAWAKLKSASGLFVQVGRQELVYDDQRILGNNDWTMAAQSHDLARLGYDGRNHRVHAIVAFNQNAANVRGGTYYINGAEPYKTMQVLWYSYRPERLPLSVSVIGMNVGTQEENNYDEPHNSTEYQQLAGAYAVATPGDWRFEGSFYHQFGRDQYAVKLKGWMAAVSAERSLGSRWSVRTGYDYLSGEERFFVPPQGAFGLQQLTEIRGFNPLFGSHHQFYGAMDFFYVTTYYGGRTPGLQNFYVSGKWKPTPRLSVNGAYHLYATAAKIENASRTLGHEMELTGAWRLLPDVSLALSYTLMHGTDTMETLKRSKGSHNLHWAWCSLTVTPQFFKTKW